MHHNNRLPLTIALSGAGPSASECGQNRESGIQSSALVGPRHVHHSRSFLLRCQPNTKPTAPQTRGNAGKMASPSFLKFVPVGNTNGAIKPKRARANDREDQCKKYSFDHGYDDVTQRLR